MVPIGRCSPTYDSTCCEEVNDGYYFCNCVAANAGGCVDTHASKVDACAVTSTGEAGESSSSSSSGEAACKYKGSCGPSSDDCECGLSCLHLNIGSYTCGTGCTTDADCARATNPITGEPYAGCSAGYESPSQTFDGLCN